MKKLNPEYVKAVTAMANESPYFRHLGMVIAEIGVGEALVEIRSQVIHHQIFGNVHGGVIASLVDTPTFGASLGSSTSLRGSRRWISRSTTWRRSPTGSSRPGAKESAWAAPWGSARRKS